MLNFSNGGKLCQTLEELPRHLLGSANVYMDFETTSGSPKITSLYPWKNCRIHGIAVTADGHPSGWYIPMDGSLDKLAVVGFVAELLASARCWVNHNLSYDALCLHNELIALTGSGYSPPEHLKFVDTLTLAKLVDSDRYTHGLEVLAKDWLGEDISQYNDALSPYVGPSQKDYGQIPSDILGVYAIQDVLTNRRLWQHIRDAIPESCREVTRTEVELTRVLFDMQCVGLKVDRQELMIAEYKTTARLLQIHDRLLSITGRSFRPHTNADCFDILCSMYGLPVLRWTPKKKASPSFDKAAMSDYATYPGAPVEVVALISEYRKLHTLLSLFIVPYGELEVNCTLHPSYNQSVRGGRLSCAMPNMQQLNTMAKTLVHPREGCKYLEYDYKSIEYRILAQYLENPEILAAYERDPHTDFHQTVADLIGIARDSAKAINFAGAYGAGVKKLLAMLSGLEVIVSAANEEAGGDKARRDALVQRKSRMVYDDYHRRMPELKRFSRAMEYHTKLKGYTETKYGRRRHLPADRAYVSLNAIVQGSAADLAKDRTVALAKSLRSSPEVNLVAVVHDSFLIECPEDFDDYDSIKTVLEDTQSVWDVPILTDMKVSNRSWGEVE